VSLKPRIKKQLGRRFVASGLHRKVLAGHGVIVSFHRVSDAIPEDALTVNSARFEGLCRLFRDAFDVLPLGDFVSRLERRESVAGALSLTFDDGYLDNFEVAAPIMRALGLPATFFVTTQFIGSTTVPWWDRGLPTHPGWMTWDHVGSLSREGFDIGAHTRRHADLGRVQGTVADDEIGGSRQELIDRLGRAPTNFAFPYGGRSNLLEENRERIRNAGFRSCVSAVGGLTPNGADPLRLPRVAISSWFASPEQFAFDLVSIKRASARVTRRADAVQR